MDFRRRHRARRHVGFPLLGRIYPCRNGSLGRTVGCRAPNFAPIPLARRFPKIARRYRSRRIVDHGDIITAGRIPVMGRYRPVSRRQVDSRHGHQGGEPPRFCFLTTQRRVRLVLFFWLCSSPHARSYCSRIEGPAAVGCDLRDGTGVSLAAMAAAAGLPHGARCCGGSRVRRA